MPTMAFVTAKSNGRFEVRESRQTPAGPRSTTLATFRVFSGDVVDQVTSRALRPVDVDRLRDGARKLGAPLEDERPDHLARQLLGEIARGHSPAPGLRRVLADVLDRSAMPGEGRLGDLAQWIEVSDDARAAALVNLLGLADAIPVRKRQEELAFPRLSSSAHRG
jgi:hypothetical protein